MYKFMVSAISVAFAFGLASSAPSAAGASSGQEVRRLQQDMADVFAKRLGREEAAPIVKMAIDGLSVALMDAATGVCPLSAEEERLCGGFMGQGGNCRRRRSVTSDLEREIIELLQRTEEDENENGQEPENRQENSDDKLTGLLQDLAKALLQDEPRLPQSEEIQSQISAVILGTLGVIESVAEANCPASNQKRLCGDFNADSSLCKRLCNSFNRNSGLC